MRLLLATALAVLLVACGGGGGGSVPRAVEEPTPTPECRLLDAVVLVHLDAARWPNLTAHVLRAQDAGQPRHLHVDRPDADAHRAASLAGIPTRSGYDRDEYPPAMSAEGGAGADVEYVPSAENRSQGASMGEALSSYCNGQAFELVR